MMSWGNHLEEEAGIYRLLRKRNLLALTRAARLRQDKKELRKATKVLTEFFGPLKEIKQDPRGTKYRDHWGVYWR